MKDIIEQIDDSQYSFILYNEGKILVKASEIGVKPIMSVINTSPEIIENSYVADKVIGKAAAMLLCKYNVSSVYGYLMSETAIDVFKAHNVTYSYKNLVPKILNRSKTDVCPLEKSVKNISNLDEGFYAITNCIKRLMENKI